MAAHNSGASRWQLAIVVRDVPSFSLWAQAIQAMLQEGLNIQCNLRTVVESVWFDETTSGHLTWRSARSCRRCSTRRDYFNACYRSLGPQNYSFWRDEKFDGLVDQIDREIDPTKRLALVHQCEAIMETLRCCRWYGKDQRRLV